MSYRKIDHNSHTNEGYKDGKQALEQALSNALMELGVKAGNVMESSVLLDYMYGARLAFWGENAEEYSYTEEDLENEEE